MADYVDESKAIVNSENLIDMECIVLFTKISKVVNALVDGVSDLPAILIGIVVAYLTILISVAIAIFGETKEFEHLDRNVILDHIVKAKALLFYLGLAFFPIMFWNSSLPFTRVFELLAWSIAIGLITNILIRSYRWMKGNKYSLRLDYLSNLRNKQDMEEAWRSVWETEYINSQNEQEFFKIFQSTIERTLDCDLKTVGKLLGDFNLFIHNRSDEFLLQRNEVLNNALDWHFRTWVKEHEYIEKEEKIEEWSMYGQLFRIIESIIENVETRALSGRTSFSFFKALHAHSNKRKKEFATNQYYVEALLKNFYRTFFDNIHNSPDRHNIWNHYFPDEWKITKSNLENNESNLSRVSLNSYLDWASPRIWEPTEEKDFTLDDVSKYLFPEVAPIIWARLLIFIFSPYDEDQLRQVVERPWNFGFLGRFKVYSSVQKDGIQLEYAAEESSTFDLAIYIFTDIFSKNNLKKYIQLLEQFSYENESVEEKKRITLITIFSKMYEFSERIGLV